MVACHRVLRYSVKIAGEELGCMFWFELSRKSINGILHHEKFRHDFYATFLEFWRI